MSDNFISIETEQWHCLGDDKKKDYTVSIPSASKSMDRLFFPLFNGIPKKSITEIVGLPGSGKTCFG
jgi:RecA/RadA recombinase